MSTEHIPTGTLFERARFKTELSGNAESHLASCEVCRHELTWMEVASGSEMQEPPKSLMDKVIQAGRNKARLKQLRNVISALLTFDSFNLAPAGVRSSSAASRQMTFEVDDVEIGVWVRPSSDQKMTLSGQVSGKTSGPVQDPSAYVDLVIEGDHVKSTPLNAWGEFMFIDVPNTPCSLQVYFRDRVIRVAQIEKI